MSDVDLYLRFVAVCCLILAALLAHAWQLNGIAVVFLFWSAILAFFTFLRLNRERRMAR